MTPMTSVVLTRPHTHAGKPRAACDRLAGDNIDKLHDGDRVKVLP